jgi:hypothetical protein
MQYVYEWNRQSESLSIKVDRCKFKVNALFDKKNTFLLDRSNSNQSWYITLLLLCVVYVGRKKIIIEKYQNCGKSFYFKINFRMIFSNQLRARPFILFSLLRLTNDIVSIRKLVACWLRGL